jgi:phospholipid/cholesterol/gamma-HCH transport system substrate-binding protein
VEPRVNYVIVGIFVVVLGAIAVGIVLWLGKSDYLDAYDQYHAFMRQSVSGLSIDSTVKYRGVDVGRVKEMSLNPDNPEEVRLTLDILQGTPIKTNTVATLETQGLTGLAIINLKGGSREAPALKPEPGEPYPVIQTQPSLFYRLDMALSRLLSDEGVFTLLTNLNAFSENANALINEDTRKRLEEILDDLSDLSHALAGQRRTIYQGIDTAAEVMDNLAVMTSHVNQDLPVLLEQIRQSATAVQKMTEDLANTGESAKTILEDSRPDLQQFTRETLGETGQLVIELRQLTSTLQRVAQQIEQQPSSLIYGRPAQPRGPGE